MIILAKIFHTLLGAVVGFITGASLATNVGVIWRTLVGPQEHGLFAIFIPLASVVCGFVGLCMGPGVALNSPKWFYRLCVPYALLAVGQAYLWRKMRKLDRPRDIVIQLHSPVGAEVVGLTRVDGAMTQHKWTLPATLQYRANRVKIACAIVDPKPDERLQVEIRCQGRSEWTSPNYPPGSEYGAACQLKVYCGGYSDNWGFGFTSADGGALETDDVEPLIKEFRPPKYWIDRD